GLPEEHFFVSPETRAYFAERRRALSDAYEQWERTFEVWSAAHPVRAKELNDAVENEVPSDLLERVPAFPSDSKIATRKAGSDVLQPIAEICSAQVCTPFT